MLKRRVMGVTSAMALITNLLHPPPAHAEHSLMKRAALLVGAGVAFAAYCWWKRCRLAGKGSRQLTVSVSGTKAEVGARAADHVAQMIRKIVSEQGHARVIFATGASQFEFISELINHQGLPWAQVTAFHLDEYVGISNEHPASFRKYLRERLFDKLSPPCAAVHYLDPSDPESYARVLAAGDIDLACIGIGENGHIAFNDPPVADFNDPLLVKLVELDEACRQQQLGEGWFPSMADVPTHAISLTVPAIMRAKTISCVVPDERKADAVLHALTGPISTACPASILRDHPETHMWLDSASASRLPPGAI